jgi:SNF2 family DNA or RNA helicase
MGTKIKNPITGTGRKSHACWRVFRCDPGTPIENKLDELWALFGA